MKVKPTKSAVKLNKSKWNDHDCKMLLEYVSESDEDDMCMWRLIAMKLNRSELACKQRMMVRKVAFYFEVIRIFILKGKYLVLNHCRIAIKKKIHDESKYQIWKVEIQDSKFPFHKKKKN